MSLSSVSQIIRALSGRQPSAQRGTDSSLSSNGCNSIQSYRHRYDVFISFRGPDTRNSFVDHLYAHLVRKGLFVFKDDKQLQKGEFISLQLQRAIQSSRVSIVVFSKDYASSTWCLDEMSTIARCFRTMGQIVFPVFYDVEPTHVRNQDGAYEHTFVSRNRSTRRFDCLLPRNWRSSRLSYNDIRALGWRNNMTTLAGLAGWDIMNKPEFPEIENIVQAVIKKLGHRLLGSVDDLIKIQPQVEALEKLLKLSSDDDGFRVLGIWGMDGIGKTTLATVLFDTISRDYEFDACCFIRDVHKIYRDGGPISLQKHILHQTLKELNLDVYNSSEIYGIITNRLYNRKLLLVLDDVDQFEQLQKLHINPKLLCPGSRIIITTRDVHILKLYGADEIYKVEWMNDNDARELLCRKAFKNDDPSNDYQELIPKVLEYAQGLPLAISIMGSFLYNRNTSQWRATLEGWENNPNRGIMEVFQSSFEGLEQREREIFLHVACFFDGEREDYVRQIVDACGLQPDIGISLLVEKSFITIRNEEIHMHKMLQELGKKNVRREDTNNPYLWSRLWVYDDFHLALMRTLKVKAIVLDQREDDDVGFNQLQLNAHYLSKLEFVELLILRHKNVSGKLESLSNALRYFSWIGYPFTYLPSNFQPHYLAYMNMSESNIEQLWTGFQEPRLYRSGFDFVFPWHGKKVQFPQWFDHQFEGGSIIRINRPDIPFNWIGFVFCVEFEVNNSSSAASGSSSHQSILSPPNPFYLSFENEYTEARFDMSLNLELNKGDSSNYLWMIYISREHCHFVHTGEQITFKARHGLIIKEWGFHVLTKEDIEGSGSSGLRVPTNNAFSVEVIDNVTESSSSFESKIQLPYNWSLSKEDEVERQTVKRKENNLSNLGFYRRG